MTDQEAMRIWREAWKTAFLGHAAYADDEAAARVIAEAMAERDAEIARLEEAFAKTVARLATCPAKPSHSGRNAMTIEVTQADADTADAIAATYGWSRASDEARERVAAHRIAARRAALEEAAQWLLGPARIEYDESGSGEHFSWWAADQLRTLGGTDGTA